MGNLNELHVPPDADEATDFAARREFGLRYDSYREGLVRDHGMAEAFATLNHAVEEVTEAFRCLNPEEAWIHSMRVDARGF